MIEDDGRRPWHSRTLAVELPNGNGYKLWIGNYEVKEDLLFDDDSVRQDLIHQFQKHQINALLNANKHYPRDWAYHRDYCGDAWIGISRYPMEPSWEDVSSVWPDWHHIMHWPYIDERMASGMPLPDEAFALAAELLHPEGYPKDLSAFTKDLIEKMQMKIEPSFNPAIFPFLDEIPFNQR